MKTKKITFDEVENLIPERVKPSVFKFFVAFSRFECALKRAGFAKGDINEVESDWDAFAKKCDVAFKPDDDENLKEACDYFDDEPPLKQIKEDGVLSWKETQKQGNKPYLENLLLMVRRVRNNLFHGGKYPMWPVDEPARNLYLIDYALTILKACIPLDAGVNASFTEVD